MINRANKADLWFTTDGDFLIDDAGDLRDTKDADNTFESVRQLVVHRLVCNKSGWQLQPEISAGLDRFVGRGVNDLLLERMRFEIAAALTVDGILSTADFRVIASEILPGMVIIAVYLVATGLEKPLLSIVYDVAHGSVVKVK